jgi:hypothetical protein
MKLIIFLLSINLVFAKDVKVVNKGEVVPFDGVLFTRELEKDIRNDIQILTKKVDTLTKINDINEKELDILNKRVKIYQDKAKEMANREVKSEKNTFFKNTLYFLSGALLTGIVSYGVIRTVR